MISVYVILPDKLRERYMISPDMTVLDVRKLFKLVVTSNSDVEVMDTASTL